jgi:hypothetical protein
LQILCVMGLCRVFAKISASVFLLNKSLYISISSGWVRINLVKSLKTRCCSRVFSS